MRNKPHIVVLTGAGISAESGLGTFRGAGGLWNGVPVTEVATPEGFAKNPQLVLQFYNERRRNAAAAKPNAGHTALVELEEKYKVTIITQNVDDLHERAGSSHVIHLHGELTKMRSTQDESLIAAYEDDIQLGDEAPDGGQWRPHIVWFGEMVPKLEEAAIIASQADIFVIIGTSLVVYPAASLVDYVPPASPIYVIDPNRPDGFWESERVHFIAEKGSIGVPKLAKQLL